MSSNRPTDPELADYPTAVCPRCGKETVDMDGFGFIACIPGCGLCTHPSWTKIGGLWECGICRHQEARL